MKILTLVDSSAVKSFYVKDKKAYIMKTNQETPYVRNQSISNECFMSIFEYPFLNDGYYVTWGEWEELPDMLRLGIIFATLAHIIIKIIKDFNK